MEGLYYDRVMMRWRLRSEIDFLEKGGNYLVPLSAGSRALLEMDRIGDLSWSDIAKIDPITPIIKRSIKKK